MLRIQPIHCRQQGFTLLEVLITLIVMTFGILGLANLQAKMHVANMESYQRAQAVLLLEDMASRINVNRAVAATYLTTGMTPAYLGVGDTQPVNPGTPCPATAGLARDQCEWSNALKGAAEIKSGANVGAMIGARGCVEQVIAPVVATCTPGVYRVTVVWQGMNPTVAPSLACGQNLYGGASMDNYRRAISSLITVGLTTC